MDLACQSRPSWSLLLLAKQSGQLRLWPDPNLELGPLDFGLRQNWLLLEYSNHVDLAQAHPTNQVATGKLVSGLLSSCAKHFASPGDGWIGGGG